MGCSVQISTHPLFRSRFHQAWLMFDLHINFRHPILIRSQDWTWSLHTYTTNKIIYTIDIPLIYHWYTIDIPLIYHWYTIDMHVLLTLMIDFSWSSSFLPRMQKIQVESNAEQLFRDMSATLLLEMHSIVPRRYRDSNTEDPQPHHLRSYGLGGKPPHRVWVARYMMI